MRTKRPGANENRGESKVGCQTINIFCTFNIDKSKKIENKNKNKNKKKKKKNKTQITKTPSPQKK